MAFQQELTVYPNFKLMRAVGVHGNPPLVTAARRVVGARLAFMVTNHLLRPHGAWWARVRWLLEPMNAGFVLSSGVLAVRLRRLNAFKTLSVPLRQLKAFTTRPRDR